MSSEVIKQLQEAVQFSPENVPLRMHLAQVLLAPGAQLQVRLDLDTGRLVEGALEIVGDQLDDLLAGDRRAGLSAHAHIMLRASGARPPKWPRPR